MRQSSRRVVHQEDSGMVQEMHTEDHFLFTSARTHGVSAETPSAAAHALQQLRVV
jgi:hypothetical protein